MGNRILEAMLAGALVVGSFVYTVSDSSYAQDPKRDPIHQLRKVEQEPRVIKAVHPKYPELALRAGIQGSVYVCAHVATDSTVSYAHVAKSSGEAILDSAAIATVKQYTIAPAIDKGKAVETAVTIPIRYKLAN